jgi:raffinose/stachyose/melibiose transport system permease protein
MRSASILLIAVVLLLASGDAAATEVPPSPRVRVEVPIFEGGEGTDFFILCAREYEKARPDVAIDLYGDPRIADKVRVRILEGSFPEATNARINYWPLIRNGDIEPLDEFLDGPNWEKDGVWRESFLPGSLDRYRHEGKVYGIPFAFFVNVIWYNKSMFERHGWKPARTWDELFVLCEKIKAAGVAPMAFQGRYPYYARPFHAAGYYHLAGAKRYQQQAYLHPGSFANAEFERALELTQQLSSHYFQPGHLGMSHTESQLQFFQGKAAMISCGSWLKSEMAGKIPDGFRLGAFNLPVPTTQSKGDPSALNVFSLYYVVMSKSRHPPEAADFLRFMTSRRMAGTFSQMRDIPTAVRGASRGHLTSDLDDVVELIESARSTYGEAAGEGFPEMEQHLEDAEHALVAGTANPRAIAQDLEADGTAVRNRAQNPRVVLVRHVWKPTVLLALLALAFAYAAWTTLTTMRRRGELAVAEPSQRLPMTWRNVLAFTGPAFALYTVFVAVPCIRSLSWSLYEWNGLTDMRAMSFVGLVNFKRLLLESDGFWIALKNNLFLMLVVPVFIVPLALFLAACISRGVIGASIFRVVFFFPNLLGGVAITLLWMHLYEGGVVNSVLTVIGLKQFEGFAWLSPTHLYWALIPMSVWGACGFYMVLYLAAMENIPLDLYEAAELDGASPARQFWQITLPLIWEVLAISLVFLVIGGMKAFEIIWLLTNQRPTTDSHVVGTRMVQTMFSEFKVGEATAIAVILFLLVFVGSTGTLRALRRETVEM